MSRLMNHHTIAKKKMIIIIFFFMALMLTLSGCEVFGIYNPWRDPLPSSGEELLEPYDLGEPGDEGASGAYGDLGDETAEGVPAADNSPADGGEGNLKPVGFVNYGEFNATVRAWTYVPLGAAEAQPAPSASTTSTANSGSGTWPNTSRFVSVPMGTYTWCIDWEEGDLDEDGQMDYFHYIEEGPTLLDENDSDDLNFAEEVAISAPPTTALVSKGKCSQQSVENTCVGKDTEVNVFSYYALEQDKPPEIFAITNVANRETPEGIQISVGGVSTPWGDGMILWQAGDFVEATTGNPYTAIGGQIHGDKTIGWARVLFDGVEVWRGDTSSYTIAEGRYGVYVEVRCFPSGTHTMRIEALGINGSGSGMSVPVGIFGFRP
jgi:hypothetical protein